MPYELRKSPNKELYWVISDKGKHMSKDPLPRERTIKQMRALYFNVKDIKKARSL